MKLLHAASVLLTEAIPIAATNGTDRTSLFLVNSADLSLLCLRSRAPVEVHIFF